jgi:uncharacterized protein (DUF1330 family)
MAIVPAHSQLERLVSDAGTNIGEVVMLNLLRYKASAGEESYGRYSETAVKMVEERGGRVLWMGRPDQVFIGDDSTDAWDAVALVSYPNRAAFLDMIAQPTYQDAHKHREGGLERTVLLPMTPAPRFAS